MALGFYWEWTLDARMLLALIAAGNCSRDRRERTASRFR